MTDVGTEVALIEDYFFYPFMVDLAACLCTTLADSGGPELCFCGIMPGQAADLSVMGTGSCGGMAWVRLDNVFPSTTFPIPDQTPTGCTNLLTASLEVGVLRSITVPNSRQLPTMADLLAESRQQMSDMAAIHRAIKCCLASQQDVKLLLGQYNPYGPDGGVVGGAWPLYIQQEF